MGEKNPSEGADYEDRDRLASQRNGQWVCCSKTSAVPIKRYINAKYRILACSVALLALHLGAAPVIRPEQIFSDPSYVALARAIENGNRGELKRFVDSGGRVDVTGKGGLSLLWFALGQPLVFEDLFKLGVDPNTYDETGEPLIGHCLVASDIVLVRLALKYGADPNAINLQTKQPSIFRAANDVSLDRLEMLLKAGADVNIRRADNATALIMASSSRQILTVRYLLQHGADPFLRNQVGNDLAAGLFGPWSDNAEILKIRDDVLRILEERGLQFKPDIIKGARIRNLGEATGEEPPMWLKANLAEPNPEWVKANPERAERWYQSVLRRPAPTL